MPARPAAAGPAVKLAPGSSWPLPLPRFLGAALFWASLAFSLVVAFLVTLPLNRWLIGRGKGHAVLHAHHM